MCLNPTDCADQTIPTLPSRSSTTAQIPGPQLALPWPNIAVKREDQYLIAVPVTLPHSFKLTMGWQEQYTRSRINVRIIMFDEVEMKLHREIYFLGKARLTLSVQIRKIQ